MKTMRVFLVVSLLLASLLFTSCMSSKEVVRTIEVSASGEVELQADIASFSIEVSELGKTTSEAQQLANQKMATLLSVLRRYQVEEKDIQTTSISLRPSYDWIDSQQVLKGQTASQRLSVTFRDLVKLGEVIDALGKVSGIYLDSITLDKEDKSTALEAARMMAVEKALAKAGLYAHTASMQLGKPITISEYSAASNPYTTRMKMAAGSEAAYDMATEVPAGVLTVSSTVSMVLEMY